MTTPITTFSTGSQIYNNIMKARSRDRPPMLTTRRYAQWQSCFLRNIDAKTNGDALRKCIFEGKEISKPITPSSKLAPEEDIDPKQAQRDKDMHKHLAVIAKYFKKIYNPTNNNIRTSLNSRNKNMDTSPRYKNDNQTGHFRNQMTVTVAGAKETIGSQVVQQTRIQCFNCKEFGHFAKECMKPKRVKDYMYHKEKMLLYKQAEKDVPLQAEQSKWLKDMDEEINE
nr:hypothetical protein [Tanacetum cinerariifolium]